MTESNIVPDRKQKVTTRTVSGVKLRLWADPDRRGVHVTIPFREAPTFRQLAAGLHAIQTLLDQMTFPHQIDFRPNIRSFFETREDGRHDLTIHARQ